jgi:AcrR family transcriptional regulator
MVSGSQPPEGRRNAILDAAAAVLRRDGISRASTKAIAREAGCSEALLYKHFPDKAALMLAVLAERVDSAPSPLDTERPRLRDTLVDMTQALVTFYAKTFPMAVGVFSDADLMGSVRRQIADPHEGPRVPPRRIAEVIGREIDAGRLSPDVDAEAVASALAGAAFQRAFFMTFWGELDPVAPDDEVASWVDQALRGVHEGDGQTPSR